ncbi:MAG: helix-turn-helix domain-containing protein [Halobacteria archaeon]|nr:helix-turn-helix domain-containing protein [Halobacteria archaeon]
MPEAKLRLSLPEGKWISEISKSYSDVLFRVVAAVADENGVGIIEMDGDDDDIETIISEMEKDEEIQSLNPLQKTDNEALVEFETSSPSLLLAAKESGMPIETPFDINDGEVVWEITASHERLSNLSERLDTLGVNFDVEYIRETEREDLLTDNQEELLLTAFEKGYYDTPRRASLDDVSHEAGIAKSTCSETLHRVEGKVIERFIEEL